MIVLQLHNRFIWLTLALGALMIGQLTVLQIRCMSGQSPFGQGMSTFDLLSAIMLMVETAVIIVMLLSLLGEAALERAWERRWPRLGFNHVAAGLSAMPVQLVGGLLLLLPTLWLHRYPELSEAQNISIPLTMLQRFLLMFLAVQLAANLLLLLRWFTRLPRWACAGLALICYWGLGWSLTWLSFTNDRYMRLNDVFFYNQLGKHIAGVPDLMRSMVTLDMHTEFPVWYLWLLLAAAALNLLWIPRAALRSAQLLQRSRLAAGTSTADNAEPASPEAGDA